MELSRDILKQFAQIANGNSNKKQTTPSYMNATAVVSDGVKYVKIDGSDQMTPVSETMGIQNGDRVLVTIENHQATVIGNYSYPADARTANEALSVGGQALTAAGQAIQRIDVLQASSITTEKLEAGLATIGYLTVTELRALIATVDTLDAKAITTDKLETESLKAGFAKIDQIEAAYATIEQLNSTNAKIETLEAGRVTAEEILGVVIKAGYLTADNADLKYATITSLNAATSRIGTLETDTLKSKDLESEVGKFGYLKASEAALQYATIGALNAEAANISNLNAEFATFKSTTTQDLIAAKGWMAEGSIGDAQISKVSANKLDAGTIDTSVVTVKGSDGKLQIVDNTLQISDANRVRVQVGKDGTGDYTLAVWDINGQLIWDALGATENTIQRAIIRDSMVSGDAAIQALKIDFQSFETALTQQGLTISGTVVQVGDKQLNVVLSEQNQYVDDSIAGIEIGGRNLITNSNFADGTDGWHDQNTSMSVISDTTYGKYLSFRHNSSVGSVTGPHIYKSEYEFIHESNTTYTLSFVAKSAGSNVTITSSVASHRSGRGQNQKTYNLTNQWQKFVHTYTIGFMPDTEIALLAFWINAVKVAVHITNIKLEKGNKATDWTPAPEDVQGQIDTHTTTLTSHETRITANENAINLRVTSQEFTEYQNGVAANFSSIDTSLSVLNGAIESKVEQVDINNAIAGLEIGGRNLLRNSNFKNGSQHWLGVNAPLNVIADSVYGNALSFYTTIKGSVSDRIYYDTSDQGFSHVAGETYTLSFFAKASVNAELQSSVAGNATSIETYELTTTWQRFTHTYTAHQHGSLSFWPVDANVTIYLTNVKLEKGNKATDWTPAPEDVDANIASISTRVSELSIDLDGITQRVSATETTTTSLESRVSTAESKLTKDGLVTTIGSYYTTLGQLNNAIDGIEIGGRNLIRGTKDMSGFYTNSANLITDEDGFTFASFSPSSLNYWKLESTVHPISFSVVRNKEVVLSFYARSDDWESLNASASNGILLTFVLCDAESTTKLRSRDVKLYTCNLSNEWQKIFITATLSDDYFTSGSGTIDDTTRIYIRFNNYSECSMQVKQFKLELGNKATDWTPAPEDTQNQLDAMNSRLTTTETSLSVLDGKIESKVTQTEIDNAIACIEIGGRNLLTKTKTLDTTGVAEKLDETYLGFTVGHYDATSLGTSSYKDVLSGWIPTKEPEAGGQYVLSFYAKGSGQIRTHFYGGSYKTILSENSSNNTNTASDGFSIFNLTSEWKKYWVRYTLESSNTLSTTGNKTVLFRVYGGNEVYVCGVKLEKGNKPTDWSPAPEDAGTIDDIIIGGRNLILQSKDFTTGSKYWSIASPWTTSVDDEGYTVASINVIGNSSTAWYRLIPQNNIPTSECTNGVIVSFDFMCDDLAALDNKCICSLQNYASDGSRIAWYEPTFDTTHARYIPGVYSFSEELENGKWVRVTVKFTYADLTKTHTEAIPDYSRLSFNLVQNGSIHIKRCKAEYGNKATDWTPAPEDVDVSISHATSIATQTADKFNWLVTSASSESSLTLTDTMLAAITKQFKVVGPDGSTTIISGGTMNINNIFAQTINATGKITASDIHATGGTIGGFTITDMSISSSTTINDVAYNATIWKNAGEVENWFWGVTVGGVAKTYLTYGGYLYANNANIKGAIDATTITVKDEYKIYTGSYGNETIIHAYDWGGDGQRAVEFGLPNTTHPSTIYMFTSSSGSVLSFYASGNASFNCRVYFESAVDIYGATSIYSSLTTSGNIHTNGGYLISTMNGNQLTMGSQNAGWCHFSSSANIPFHFNRYISVTDKVEVYQSATYISNGTIVAGRSDSSNAQVYVQNSLRKGRIAANSSGHLGFYDDTNASWIIYSNYSSNITYVNAPSFLLLHANKFAIRIGEGVNGDSYKVVMPVTSSNAASNNVVYLGVPSARWKFIYSASSVNVSSDERDKNITELDERYLDAFHKLNVITYRWKNEPEKLHIGFSAQAVKRAMNTHGIDTTDMGAICHDFWTDEETGEEKERYSLCYEEITLLTVPVVQKHSVTLTEHAAKLVNIESQLESLKTELDEAHIQIAKQQKLIEALQSAS